MTTKVEISITRRALAYSATSLAFGAMNSVFKFYYVKIFLNRYMIEETWFHISQIIFMIWNAINDPLFAYVQDKANYSFVKTRRQSILFIAPFFALSFLIPWFPWSIGTWLTGLHLVISLCLYDAMYTFAGLAQCCLNTEISTQQTIRLKLIQFAEVAGLLGSSSILICEFVSGSLQNYVAFQLVCIVIAIISWLCMRYTGLNAFTEYELQQVCSTECSENSGKMKDTTETMCTIMQQLLRDRNFLSFVGMNFFQEFHRTFISNFTVIIVDQLVSSTDVPLSVKSTFYGLLNILSQVLVIFGTTFVGRVGYYRVFMCNFLIKILLGLTLFTLGLHHPWVLLFVLLIDSAFTFAAFCMFNLPLSDIADENSRKYNRQHPISSMIYGTNALIVKPAISLAPMLVVGILNRNGYNHLKNKSLLPSQVDQLHNVMFNLLCFIPITVGFVQFIIWSFYSLRHTHEKPVVS